MMPLSGSVGLATRCGSIRAGRLGPAAAPAFAAGPLLCRPRLDLLLLARVGFGGTALKLRLAGTQARQAVLTPGQLLRHHVTMPGAEQPVLPRIHRLRLGHHPADLLLDRRGAAVRLERGAGL